MVTLAATVGALLSAQQTEQQIRGDTERLLQQFAVQIGHSLRMSLLTRRSLLQASAAQIVASADRGDAALTHHLQAVRNEFPEFTWLGVADDRGYLTTQIGDELESGDVSLQTWFKEGRMTPYLGRLHFMPRSRATEASTLSLPPAQEVIDMAVPLRHADGTVVGVIGARLAWDWLRQITHVLEQTLDTTRSVQVWILDSSGQVLINPYQTGLRAGTQLADPSEEGKMLVGRHNETLHRGETVVDWQVIVRQELRGALSSDKTARTIAFLTTWLSGLVAALLAAVATGVLLRRLRRLAEQAQAIQSGASMALESPAGKDEVAQIGGTLASAIDQLQREKQALVKLNIELDHRVSERTARIERMAEEARHAAVVRERLRLARELHDTLAHSLMALLAQLRLIRKLRPRLPGNDLDAELQRAEEVAASGLDEARAAITQMRHNSVNELGLGTALAELLQRFGQRTGLQTHLHGDEAACAMAGERAETAFRIVEEALRNVERHARASGVEIRLTVQAARIDVHGDAAAALHVRLEISDDGIGFDPSVSRPGHYGLRGMREQAELIQATLHVHSTIGQGTRLVLELDA